MGRRLSFIELGHEEGAAVYKESPTITKADKDSEAKQITLNEIFRSEERNGAQGI
jgi:hypothetical protein